MLIESWPDLWISLPDLNTPLGVRVNVGSGIVRTLRETSFGVGRQQLRTDEDLQLPIDVVLGWAADATLRYRSVLRSGEGTDPTGDTQRNRSTHRVSLGSSLVAPAWLPLALARPLRLSVAWVYIAERDCRAAVGSTTCVAFVDQLTRSVNLSLDTRLAGLEVGLNAGYVDRQSFVGQRSGSTQFQLGLFGQFMFEAGQLPVLPLG